MAAEKYYYTPEDFEQLKGDLRDGLITVRIMTTASSALRAAGIRWRSGQNVSAYFGHRKLHGHRKVVTFSAALNRD
jgi:hypothetical protein